MPANLFLAYPQYLPDQNCEAPFAEILFDGFYRGEPQESINFSRGDAVKDAERIRRRAYVFDSLTAKEWLPEFTENAKEYDLKSFEEKESYGQYYITFARKVGDIFTDECSEISVMYDGSVKYVSVQYDGKYDGVSEDVAKGITEEGLESYARSQMDIIYPNAEGEFVMNDHSLEKDENGYYIAIYGELDNRLERVRYYLEN